jgi:hypothetical protein
VLRFRSNEGWNVGVRIFPQRGEILIGRLGFGGVALHCVCACETETGQREKWVIRHKAAMVEEFLELHDGFAAFLKKQIRPSAHRDGIKQCTKFEVGCQAEFIRNRGLQKLDGLGRVTAIDCNGCSDSGQPIAVDDGRMKTLGPARWAYRTSGPN